MCVSLKSLSDDGGVVSLAKKRLGLRRKKIWELEHRFHCSVAGTCFTLDEMRRFCRKCHIDTNGTISDYELHTNFVSILSDAQVARPAAKYLDRKFKTSMQLFDQADSATQLKFLWDEAIAKGEIAAAFWSILTHPMASEDLLFYVYGEVHMLSHLSGASIRLDMRALTQFRRRVPKLEEEITQLNKELLRRTRKKDEIIETLNKRVNNIAETEKSLQAALKKINFLESADSLQDLRTQVAQYADTLKQELKRAERAEIEAAQYKTIADARRIQNAQTQSEFLAVSAECRALENTLESALQSASPGLSRGLANSFSQEERKQSPQKISRSHSRNISHNLMQRRSLKQNTLAVQHPAIEKLACQQGDCKNSGTCAQQIDLAGRCILYVGGRNSLCVHFRTLVEQHNGTFIHHDGGREESPHRLDSLMSQVDAVLCPLDCVSHDAVNRIKRDCKRYGKHLALLSHSSLSAFAKGIYEFSKTAAVAH